MDFKESAEIIKAGLIWANWTDEQQTAMKKALITMQRYENVVAEAVNLYNGVISPKTFGSRVTNIIDNDID